MKILGTGLSGLVGSRIVDLLSDEYSFQNISLETGLDITDKKSVHRVFSQSKAPIVLHCAAKAQVDGCENDKEKDTRILGYKDSKKQEEEWKREKTAWAVNAMGTRFIVEACKRFNKKIIYISTDFVFDGELNKEDVNKETIRFYTEEDTPYPVNWYGQTKYEGEKLVRSAGIPYLILRIAYPYRSAFERPDFIRTILDKLQSGEKLSLITDHYIMPTFIDDIARACDVLIKEDATGIFHTVGSQLISPYDIGVMIANIYNCNHALIGKTTRQEYFRNCAPRPFFLGLQNDKIERLGVKMVSVKEGLLSIQRQATS